ncbi:MAG: hypothetical protein MR782_04130 [Campylobacter sp.]|nr:hypothetical protein [Campylobacter sp.]MCI6340032.1 hypothetical protein [Campylobacter sp.]MCI6343124.1 hypothetical protein [Campylobacter sp.]MCI6694466.1 hypothetical protein [Campylobacter sp.]MCI7362033.1 hypothetical protein [Campylobacter sp.]MDY4445965.1 hypothetical protein [Campylobacter sp.]
MPPNKDFDIASLNTTTPKFRASTKRITSFIFSSFTGFAIFISLKAL